MSSAARVLGPQDLVEYDPFSYEQDEDPYPIYRWMRDFAPAYHNERLNFWALTRFQDNLDAFLDAERFASGWGTSLEFMDGPKDNTGLMIYMDPPRHTRYRKLISKAFTPRSIGACSKRLPRNTSPKKLPRLSRSVASWRGKP